MPSPDNSLLPTDGGPRREMLSIHSQVVDALGRRITRGDPAPGDVFPTETELALEMGVSRTVLREAMRVLAEKGMVSARPKIGTTVRPQSMWRMNDPVLLGWLFEERLDPILFRDLLETRRIIEPAAAGLAAERGTDAEIREIGHWVSVAAQAAPGSRERNEADLKVHGALVTATHNQLLQALVSTLQAAMVASRDLTSRIPSDEIPYHRRVHEALVARDPRSAEEAMRQLIGGVESDLAAALELSQGPPKERG